jgi:hypothetical protein
MNDRRADAFRDNCNDGYEVSIDAAQATPGPHREPERPLPLDQIGILEDDIRIRRRDVAYSAQRLRSALLIATLTTALGLALIVGFQFLVFAPAQTAIEHKPKCSDHTPDSGEASCVAHKSDREVVHSGPDYQRIATPAADISSHEPSHSITRQATASTNGATLSATQTPKSPAPRATAIQPERTLPKLTAVAETKPSTIDGWTVRDVVGGTATLEGPNGTLKATSGDTVLGLGKIDSIVRWGGRWIIATSRGLISTP